MKKNHLTLVSFLGLFLFSTLIFANGNDVTGPQKNATLTISDIQSYQDQKNSITVNLVPGSLKANIERIAKDNGWEKVVWSAPNDYNWTTNTKIKDQNLVAIMKAILAYYPLQAVFYQGNRVLVIQTRTVR